jgi:hypothetical protein
MPHPAGSAGLPGHRCANRATDQAQDKGDRHCDRRRRPPRPIHQGAGGDDPERDRRQQPENPDETDPGRPSRAVRRGRWSRTGRTAAPRRHAPKKPTRCATPWSAIKERVRSSSPPSPPEREKPVRTPEERPDKRPRGRSRVMQRNSPPNARRGASRLAQLARAASLLGNAENCRSRTDCQAESAARIAAREKFTVFS